MTTRRSIPADVRRHRQGRTAAARLHQVALEMQAPVPTKRRWRRIRWQPMPIGAL